MKITNLRGYWLEANEATFDALVKAGYSIYDHRETDTYETMFTGINNDCVIYIDKDGAFLNGTLEQNNGETQAFHHQGNFYTINGEWEKELTYGEDEHKERWLKKGKNTNGSISTISNGRDSNLRSTDSNIPDKEKKGIDDTEAPELTFDEHQKAVEPFLITEAKRELKINEDGYLSPKDAIQFMLGGGECMEDAWSYKWNGKRFENNNGYPLLNFTTLKPKPKPKDPHADIKARYAEAKEAEANGGLVVKVFHKDKPRMSILNPIWSPIEDYELRFFKLVEVVK